jgi:NADPH-dependent curcumin reductase CurA
MAQRINRSWRMAKDSDGEPSDGDILWDEQPAATPADGEVLVQVTHAVVDPMLWTIGLPAPAKDQPVPGAALGVVIESRDPSVKVGDKISGLFGWQTYVTVPAGQVAVHDPAKGLRDEDYLGAVSYIGATAYLGVREITKPTSADTVVLTAGAGAVGSIAGQLAKLEGARVVGIATSAEQCAWLIELGFDVAIDRRTQDLAPALAQACPDGIDVVIDGLGGSVLDACLARLGRNARVALFGAASAARPTSPVNFPAIVNQRAKVQGFRFLDFPLQLADALDALAELVTAGKIRYRLETLDGLEHAPAAMRRVKSEADTIVLRLRA